MPIKKNISLSHLFSECLTDYLKAGHSGREHESHVVSVDHGEDTDGPGCDAPRVLERQLLLTRLLGIFKNNLKHPGEVLTQMVGCSTLRRQNQIDKNFIIRQKVLTQNIYY